MLACKQTSACQCGATAYNNCVNSLECYNLFKNKGDRGGSLSNCHDQCETARQLCDNCAVTGGCKCEDIMQACEAMCAGYFPCKVGCNSYEKECNALCKSD